MQICCMLFLSCVFISVVHCYTVYRWNFFLLFFSIHVFFPFFFILFGCVCASRKLNWNEDTLEIRSYGTFEIGSVHLKRFLLIFWIFLTKKWRICFVVKILITCLWAFQGTNYCHQRSIILFHKFDHHSLERILLLWGSCPLTLLLLETLYILAD